MNSKLSRREMFKYIGMGAGAAALGGCAPKTETTTTGAKKYAGKTIRMLSQGGAGYEKAVVQYAKEYEEQTGCKVEFDWAPWENLMPKLQADLASGSPQLDIFCNDREFQYSVYPDLLPLDDLIKKYNYDMNGFIEPVYKFGVGIAGQKSRFGLPLGPGVSVVFYRTDLIKEFPKTWVDYEKLLVDMKDKTGKPPLGFAGVAAQLVKAFFARYWSMKQPLISKDWKPLIANETGVKAPPCSTISTRNTPHRACWPGTTRMAAMPSRPATSSCWKLARLLPGRLRGRRFQGQGQLVHVPYPDGGSGNYVEHNMLIMRSPRIRMRPSSSSPIVPMRRAPSVRRSSLLSTRRAPPSSKMRTSRRLHPGCRPTRT